LTDDKKMNTINQLLFFICSGIFAMIWLITGTAFAAGGGEVLIDPGAMEGKHFHPKGKLPSESTFVVPVVFSKGTLVPCCWTISQFS